MSSQVTVYSTVYNNYVREHSAFVLAFIEHVTSFFMKSKIIDLPDDKLIALMRSLRNLFLSTDAKGAIGPNAVYKAFLIHLLDTVTSPRIHNDERALIHTNLFYLEQEGITGFISYDKVPDGFIHNTLIMEIIQNEFGIPSIPTGEPVNKASFNKMIEESTEIYKKSSRKRGRNHANKPPCPYGASCYRTKNPKHMEEYSHPRQGGKRKSKKIHARIRQTRKK